MCGSHYTCIERCQPKLDTEFVSKQQVQRQPGIEEKSIWILTELGLNPSIND